MRIAILATLLLVPSAEAGQVLVVDDDGGAGVGFTEIQAAVDAAADGDVVLVRSGTYAPFQVVGKGVTVLSDVEQTVVVNGPIEVSGTPADSLVVLRGLQTGTPLEHGASIEDCAGAVRVEECDLRGWKTPSDPLTAHLVGHGV